MSGEVFRGAETSEVPRTPENGVIPATGGLLGMFYRVNGIEGFRETRDFERQLAEATDEEGLRNILILQTISDLHYDTVRGTKKVRYDRYTYSQPGRDSRTVQFSLLQAHKAGEDPVWYGAPTSEVVDSTTIYKIFGTAHDVMNFLYEQRMGLDEVTGAQ